MENMKLKISEWWNAPQKKDFKSLLFGKETLRLINHFIFGDVRHVYRPDEFS